MISSREGEVKVIHPKRAVTPDTALRLAQVRGVSTDFWLGLQQDWELWHTLRSRAAAKMVQLKPLSKTG